MAVLRPERPVAVGDLLVVSVVSDDLTNLTVVQPDGLTLVQIAATTSLDCRSGTGLCQARVYWGVARANVSGPVTIMENGSDVALRVQAWEFSGVNSVSGWTACSNLDCVPVSYPSGAVLFATARSAFGPGPGFAWTWYDSSGLAGSEYQITTASGSTAFPFSHNANGTDLKVGVVLTR